MASRTLPEMQMPAGSANAARRAAMLLPSTEMLASGLIRLASLSAGNVAVARVTKSSPFAVISPISMPTRNVMRRSGDVPILRSMMPRYTSTAHRTASIRAGEFDKQTVPGRFDDATVMLCNPRIYELMAIRLQPFESAFLVLPDQAGVAHHISGEHCDKMAGGSHCSLR